MRFAWRFAAVVVALAAGSLLLAACGDGDEEDLNLDQYFRRLDEIEEDMKTGIGALDEEFQIAAEDVEATQNYFEGYQDVVEQGINDMKDMRPPAEARDAHDEFVAALGDMLPLWDDLAQRLADVESTSEMQALLVGLQDEQPWQTASQRSESACLQLQGIAEENGIEIDLGCE